MAADENKDESLEHVRRKLVEADWFQHDASPKQKEDAIHGAYEAVHPTDKDKKAARKRYEDRERDQFLGDIGDIW